MPLEGGRAHVKDRLFSRNGDSFEGGIETISRRAPLHLVPVPHPTDALLAPSHCMLAGNQPAWPLHLGCAAFRGNACWGVSGNIHKKKAAIIVKAAFIMIAASPLGGAA